MHKNLVGPLKEKGFIVEQAFNGQEGVETALSTKPDLVICDIEMPVMNGFEACAEIGIIRLLKTAILLCPVL